ncbi:MAG: dihydrofolate reductase [Spirochaetales bacterium]|nr:dihydrofolate reductase [Spirochaetales bacterium]
MRNIIAFEFISLDGVIQSPGREDEDREQGFTLGGWISRFNDEALSEAIREEMNLSFDLLLGRKTYDIWAPYWPRNDSIWPAANRAVKYVPSRTIDSGTWDKTVILKGDLQAAIADLKSSEGPDLHIYGSSVLMESLMEWGLVDELRLKIYPVVLGSGKKLFSRQSAALDYSLVQCITTSCGVIMTHYKKAEAL